MECLLATGIPSCLVRANVGLLQNPHLRSRGAFAAFKPQPWPSLGISRRQGLHCSVDMKGAQSQSAEELQAQLETLMEEAKEARDRADKARARFMRLTEAVEQMSLRAAAEVKTGNEGAARELLMEKKNVMFALELSKRRAGILEELAAKLNEVISKKETSLIAALSWASLNIDSDNKSSPDVRIVSPREENEGNSYSESELSRQDTSQLDEVEAVEAGPDLETELLGRKVSFQEYMLDIDKQIGEIEANLEQFLDVATILDENKLMDERVKTVARLLQYLQRLDQVLAGLLRDLVMAVSSIMIRPLNRAHVAAFIFHV